MEAELNFYLTGELPQELAADVFRSLSVLVADLVLVCTLFDTLVMTSDDLIQIWRCWVLYGGKLKVIAVPSLCVITETGKSHHSAGLSFHTLF